MERIAGLVDRALSRTGGEVARDLLSRVESMQVGRDGGLSVVPGERRAFAQIPEWLVLRIAALASSGKGVAVGVLSLMALDWYWSKGTAISWRSQRAFAAALDCRAASVSAAVAELEALGIIRRATSEELEALPPPRPRAGTAAYVLEPPERWAPWPGRDHFLRTFSTRRLKAKSASRYGGA